MYGAWERIEKGSRNIIYEQAGIDLAELMRGQAQYKAQDNTAGENLQHVFEHNMSAATERYYQESKRGAQLKKDNFKKYVKDHSLMVIFI